MFTQIPLETDRQTDKTDRHRQTDRVRELQTADTNQQAVNGGKSFPSTSEHSYITSLLFFFLFYSFFLFSFSFLPSSSPRPTPEIRFTPHTQRHTLTRDTTKLLTVQTPNSHPNPRPESPPSTTNPDTPPPPHHHHHHHLRTPRIS